MGKMCFLLWFLLLVHGVLGDKVIVRVTKGEDVTLPSSTEVQRKDQILWKFKALSALNDSIIVNVEEAVGIYTTSIDGRFRDRLKMDNKTGSLTITSVTSEDAGIYQLDINNDKGTNLKQFDVTVREEELVSVTEGNSVTLQTGVTDKQRDDLIVWKFNDEVIPFPSLNDRNGRWSNIHLNDQTGELEFTRIQRNQSGLYEVKINTSRLISHRKFRVTVDKAKTESVMEGDSVTLNPDSTQIQGIILIQWRFGVSVIAETKGNETSYPHLSEIFGGRLQLDQTGSLTINNIRTKHSGLYKLEVKNNTGMISSMAFSVTVYESPSVIGGKAEMKSVSVMEGDSVTLQTDVAETHGDELIVWRFGDEGKLIAKCDIEANSSPLYETEERFRDRLKLNNQTGSLNITNITTEHSGLYTVKISSSSSNQTIYKRFNVTVSDKPAPDSGLSSGAVAGIVVGLLLFAAVIAAAGVIYHRHKISELERRRDVVSNGTNDPLNAETANSDAS